MLAGLSRKGIEVRIITSKVDYNLKSLEILKACENSNLSFLVLDNENGKSVFIHAKIYLIDKKYGISGSANLTYSGFNSNVETLSISENEQEVLQIERDFMSLWLKYENKSMSKEELSKGTTYPISRALPLVTKITDKDNCRLKFFPYYFFEFILRGSVRNPPMVIEDRGSFVLDGLSRKIRNNTQLINEIRNKAPTDYVVDTENKFSLEIAESTIMSYKEANELALDYIIQKNTREYYQTYGSRSYKRLYVPRKYEISFLKNYSINVPLWNYDILMSDRLWHNITVFGYSGSVWKDKLYCPVCKTKMMINESVTCSVCGKITCQQCIQESGLIFKKKLCPKCYKKKNS